MTAGTTTAPAANRASRKRALTRRRLIDAGRRVIAERGVAGLRVQAVTEEADVALGSFYNHFSSKDGLVEAIVSESLSELAAATVPAGWEDEDPRAIVAGALLRFVRLGYEHPGFARLVVNLSRAEVLFGLAVHPYARRALEHGIEQGVFRVARMDVALSVTIGGAFALIREVLGGAHDDGADEAFAVHCLISFGVAHDEAVAVCGRVAERVAAGETLRPLSGLVAAETDPS